MSMNLYVTIDGQQIDTPHTSTKMTSQILGFDVEKENENGFSTGRFISSKEHPKEFEEALDRLGSIILENIVSEQDLKNNPFLNCYMKINEGREKEVIRDNEFQLLEVKLSFL